MSGQTIHVVLDIRGALLWNDDKLVGLMADDDGRSLSPREAREALMDELAKGRSVLPLGEPCEGFSYKTGCPGHERPNIDATFGGRPSVPENRDG